MRVAFTLHHALQPCHWPLGFAGMSCDLRSLELHITIYLSAVMDLLQHMPLLHRLSIPYISTAPESFLAASVSGCGARLETLQMGFCDYQMSTSSLCLAVLEFVAGFERLLWLVHEPGFAAELRGCIKLFAARRCLPHLARVCIDDLGGGAQAPA
ncbi:hypothetical protein GGF37_003913 [Kickxella alabastrina]|nr:hypothetical protein GGF37_003913 [Kickxella alabastrina]